LAGENVSQTSSKELAEIAKVATRQFNISPENVAEFTKTAVSKLSSSAGDAVINYITSSQKRQNSYLIGFRPDCTEQVQNIKSLLQVFNITMDWSFSFNDKVHGVKVKYMGPSFPSSLLESIKSQIPCISYIEEDALLATKNAKRPPTAEGGNPRSGIRMNSLNANSASQQNACVETAALPKKSLWGLDTMDGELDGRYQFSLTGEGVNMYFIDSGIREDHTEFSGRASNIFVAQSIRDSSDPNGDCTGHGTHVAGIGGGYTVGVAKGAKIFGLRIIGCDKTGAVSDAVEALVYLSKVIQKPAVINMSLGSSDGLRGNTLPAAISALTSMGVPVVIAAGNSAQNICNGEGGSPSLTQIPNTFVVGALDRADRFSFSDAKPKVASFSNRGACVTYWAPGEEIWSASPVASDPKTDAKAFEIRRGTSQAAPFVAGVLALHLQVNPNASPAELASAVSSSGRPLSWGGIQVLAPKYQGSPGSSLSSLQFPLSQCTVSRGFWGYMESAFGNSRVAIVVAITLGLLIVISAMVACCVCFRRRQRQKQVVQDSPGAFENSDKL
jgi:subtilisin family serine protease